jgi:Tfp pilus assembly protein PilP
MKNYLLLIISLFLITSCSAQSLVDQKTNDLNQWADQQASELEKTASGYYNDYSNKATDYVNQKVDEQLDQVKDQVKESIKNSINQQVDEMLKTK